MGQYKDILGKTVVVTVDRPLGSNHPNHKDLFYSVNYGYVEDIIGGDNEEQDAYLLGVNMPVQSYRGVIIAVIHRLNDVEDKWVVAPTEINFTKEQIKDITSFQEQFFDIEIYC